MKRPASVRVLCVAALGAGVLAAIALAEPAPVSGPVRVNPDVARDQFSSSVAMAPDGHFAVAYQEDNAGQNAAVLVQLFNASAIAQGQPIPVNDGAAGTRQLPRLGMAGDGTMAVVYVRVNGDTDVAAQRLSPTGQPQGPELTVNTTLAGNQQAARMAMAADGHFAAAWVDNPTSTIRARTYDADGTPSAELTVSQGGTGLAAPAIAIDGDGRFVVVWARSMPFGQPGVVMARRYAADGTPQAGEFQALTGEVNFNYNTPVVGLADDGRMIVVARPNNGQSGIVAQRLSATNAAEGAVFRVDDVSGYPALAPDVVMDRDGDAVITWDDEAAGSHADLKHFAGDGTQQGNQVIANPGGSAPGDPNPAIAGDGAARIAIAYTGGDGGGPNQFGVFTRRFDYAEPLPPPTQTTTTTTMTQPPTILPPSDFDHDGVTDFSDNCSAVANSDQLDDDHNGIGNACEPPHAVLTVSPNPTCTGIPVRFDASGSTSRSAIVNYRFEFEVFGEVGPTGHDTTMISDGATPTASWSFNWVPRLEVEAKDLQAAIDYQYEVEAAIKDGVDPPEESPSQGPFGRPNTTVKLTITDAVGAQATTTQRIRFAQHSPSFSRTGCPHQRSRVDRSFTQPSLAGVRAARSSVVFLLSCTSTNTCFGALTASVSSINALKASVTHRRRASRIVIGGGVFSVPARSTGNVKARLTRRGKRLLRARRSVPAQLTILSIAPSGKLVTRSRNVTLKRPRP